MSTSVLKRLPLAALAGAALLGLSACSEVPQACIIVIAGVEGASVVPITVARAMFQSREWVTTAPPTTSSICAPLRPYRSTRPCSAPVSSC